MKDPKDSCQIHLYRAERKIGMLGDFFEDQSQAGDKNGDFWDGPKAICKDIESILSKAYDDLENMDQEKSEWTFLPEVRVMYPYMKRYVDRANECAEQGFSKRDFVEILLSLVQLEYGHLVNESFDGDALEITRLIDREPDPQKRAMMVLSVRCWALSTESKEKQEAFLQDLSKLTRDGVASSQDKITGAEA